MTQAPIDVAVLPQASNYLNFCKIGPPVGKYLGPNTMGEFVTVVSNERVDYGDTIRHRIGVAWGCYTINGEPTDPEGLPPDVALGKIRRDWQALKTPGIAAPSRAGKPTKIRPHDA